MFVEGPTGGKNKSVGEREEVERRTKGGKGGARELGVPDEQGESCQSGRVAINVLSSGFSIVSKNISHGATRGLSFKHDKKNQMGHWANTIH